MLAKWEKFTGWFLEHTARWPRSARFTLCQRVQDHALEVVELLVVAHYEPRERKRRLHEASLLLERMRYLFRLARAAKVMPARGFESATRGVDEVGRMLHGWRQSLRGGRRAEAAS